MTVPGTSEVAGFDRVYRQHLLPITRLAFLLVRSQAVAEDLAHDAFVRHYFLARPDPALPGIVIGQTGIGTMSLSRPLGVDSG
jgi:hypothetical protein